VLTVLPNPNLVKRKKQQDIAESAKINMRAQGGEKFNARNGTSARSVSGV
jgi:hypothetical protein